MNKFIHMYARIEAKHIERTGTTANMNKLASRSVERMEMTKDSAFLEVCMQRALIVHWTRQKSSIYVGTFAAHGLIGPLAEIRRQP